MYHGKVVPLGKVPEGSLSSKVAEVDLKRVDERNSALQFSEASKQVLVVFVLLCDTFCVILP